MKKLEIALNIVAVAALATALIGFLDRFARKHSISSPRSTTHPLHRRLTAEPPKSSTPLNRLLYIVTSIHEFDIGRRGTVQGYDRFTHTLVPVIRESVKSMIQEGFQPDVYLITQYNVSSYRYGQLRVALPESVGLQVWSEATPLMYMQEHENKDKIQLHTRGLARQHRYVIKDKLWYYDTFVNFEDDMLVRGPQVSHFVNLTNDIYQWRQTANRIPTSSTVEVAKDNYYGRMTQQQLGRTIPGFIRVEAALPDFVPLKRNRFDLIPIHYEYDSGSPEQLDPSICCRVENFNGHVPPSPPVEDLYFWETSIEALGVRRLPNDKDWVILLGGSNNEVWEYSAYVVGDFWSGRAGNFFGGRERPDRKKGKYMSNQGGWMGTRRQIKEWHERWCRGGFLPYVVRLMFIQSYSRFCNTGRTTRLITISMAWI